MPSDLLIVVEIKPNIKGKLGKSFYRLKVFISSKLREVSIGNFHQKAPNCPKIGSKCQKLTNKDQVSFDLLWESTNSVIGAAVGIH